jgi:ABC-type uncharacterized transport system permease subunit
MRLSADPCAAGTNSDNSIGLIPDFSSRQGRACLDFLDLQRLTSPAALHAAMTFLPTLIAIPLYLATAALLALRLARKLPERPLGRGHILAIAGVATVLHLAALWQHLFTASGVNLSFFNAISLLTWLLSLVLVVSSIRQPTENLGIAAFPLAAFGMALEEFLPSSDHLLQSSAGMLELHVLISVSAYSILILAALQAVLLAVQDSHLHGKHPGGFVRVLPPLQTMERLLFQLIGIGFLLQSLSLLTGFIFLEDMFAQHLVHKTVLSVAAWAVFAVLLWGRWRFGWRGRTAIRWTLTGVLFLLIAYLGSKLVLELILGY